MQGLKEAAALMSDYTRKIYPDLFPSLAAAGSDNDGNNSAAAGAGSTSIADEIAAELAELAGDRLGPTSAAVRLPSKRLREEGEGHAEEDEDDNDLEQRTGRPASNPVPIRTAFVCRALGVLWFYGAAGARVDPCLVLDSLMMELDSTKQQCARFIDRLLPLQRIVRCDMEEILSTARELLGSDIEPLPLSTAAETRPEVTTAPEASGVPTLGQARTWCAEVRVRNTDAISRSLLTAGLGDLMRRRFRVDLDRGSHTIIIEACMSIAGVSVVRNGAFWRFARYNIRLLSETDAEREARLLSNQAAVEAARARKACAAAIGTSIVFPTHAMEPVAPCVDETTLAKPCG